MSESKKQKEDAQKGTRNWMIRVPDEKMAEVREFMEAKGIEPSYMRHAFEEAFGRIDIQSAYDAKAFDGPRVTAEEAAAAIEAMMNKLASHLDGDCDCEDQEDHDVSDAEQANEELAELAVEAEQDSLDPNTEIQ